MEGIAVFTWEICRRMAEQHPEDQFYFFFDRKPSSSFTLLENVNSIILRPQARHPLLWNYWFEHALTKALNKHEIDVFFSPEFYLSKATSIPTVIVTHDLGFLHYPDTYKRHHLDYFKKQVPLFLNKANHIIAVSEFTKQDIITSYNIDSEKITIAGNACRSTFKQLNNSEKKAVRKSITGGVPYLLYLGSIHPRKNVLKLVNAFNVFKEKTNHEHKLVLYGRWAFKNNEIKEAIKQSPHQEDIFIIGDDDFAVEKVVASASCVVYPSLYEGFGIPILEAMTCGVQVITSDRGAMKEVGGNAAIYINPESIEDIAKAMDRLCAKQEVDEDVLFKNASRYSWETSANQVYESLRSVVR